MSSLKHLQNGRYTILEKLGEGGKGVVYKARDTVLDRVVAVKVLKSEVLSEEAYSRVMREARVVAKLDHSNIVPIYDIGKEDGKQFFVLAFVDGMNLRGLMGTYREGKCDLQTILRIGLDVCGALQYAHSRGVLHRDIKPENILITEEGTAKLMDFGLAKALGGTRITKRGMIVGTPAYLPPEQALGKDSDQRSDLYSLGATLYHMATGRPPFPGDDPVKVIFSHINDIPMKPGRINPDIDAELERVILKLLKKDPDERYQSAEKLKEALQSIGGVEERLAVTKPGVAVQPTVSLPSPEPIWARPLVDRENELSTLKGRLDDVLRGEGSLVFVTGEAGIGKTRLLMELKAYAKLRGALFLVGNCYREGAVPYKPWVQIIGEYSRRSRPELLYKVAGIYSAEIVKLVPEAASKLGAVPSLPALTPEGERLRLFEAVTQFFINASKENPLVLFLDNLQWGDLSTMQLLHHLGRSLKMERLTIAGAYRDLELEERKALSECLLDMNRERLFQALPLRRLNAPEVRVMVKQTFGDKVPPKLAKLVYEKSGGNPFFVEEILRSLAEERMVQPGEKGWVVPDVSRVRIPRTVKAVVTQRLEHLDEACRRTLSLAAVVGREFDFQVLKEITGLEEDQLVTHLDDCLRDGLIQERRVPTGEIYTFTDNQVRDVLYEEVSTVRRRRLHIQAGQILEKLHAKNLEEHADELAYHFHEGRDNTKALKYFLKAGDRAMKVYANEEASSHFESALNLLDRTGGDVREKARVAEALGDLKYGNMEYEASLEYFNEALELLKETRDKRGQARIHDKMAEILTWMLGRYKDALTHLNEALKVLKNEPTSRELGHVYWDLADIHLWCLGDLSKAVSLGRKALNLAEEIGALDVKAGCYIELIFTKLVDFQKATKYVEEGLNIAIENNIPEIAVDGYYYIPLYHIALGNFHRAMEYLEEGLEFSRKVGNMSWSGWMMAVRAMVYTFIGDLQKAIETAEDTIQTTKKTGDLYGLCIALSVLGGAYRTMGEWDKAYEYYVQALEIAERMHDHAWLIIINSSLGRLCYEKEEHGKAEEILQKQVEVIEKIGGKIRCPAQLPYWGFVPYIWLSELQLKIGRLKKAKDLADVAYEVAVKSKSRLYLALANRVKAMLFNSQKAWESSIESFEKSKREFEAMNAIPELIQTLYEYGSTYLQRNQKGDREKAHSLLDQALEISRKIGAKKWIEKIIAKKKLLTA
ncbi:MAG: tetratricopeptide repeat protein [Candidatus Bathyarchaeota archaeon]|nr:MAG: tetratricopeptide repeat protein [Candidatus Bathyarchaeota archaeon]